MPTTESTVQSVEDMPLEALLHVIERRQISILQDPEALEALLRDYCPNKRSEVNLLLNALKEGVPQAISDSPLRTVKEALLGRLRMRLQQDQGMSESSARWAAETWYAVLRPTTEEPAPEEPPKALPKEAAKAVVVKREEKKAPAAGGGPPAAEPKKEDPWQQPEEQAIEFVRQYLKEGATPGDVVTSFAARGVAKERAEELTRQLWQELSGWRRFRTRAIQVAMVTLALVVIGAVLWFGVGLFLGSIFSLGEAADRWAAGDYFGVLKTLAPIVIGVIVIKVIWDQI